MSILSQLSSQVGDRSESSNRKVVMQCLHQPVLLEEIADGLRQKDAALLGDCAEVMTGVAEGRPEWVAPYAEDLAALLGHKATRVRWEAMHALALIAVSTPGVIAALLPQLEQILHSDASVIVRDHATDAVASYAGTGIPAAQQAYPLLRYMLTAWDGKQAAHALKGLGNVAFMLPETRGEIKTIAEAYQEEGRAVVRKEAKDLLRQMADL